MVDLFAESCLARVDENLFDETVCKILSCVEITVLIKHLFEKIYLVYHIL